MSGDEREDGGKKTKRSRLEFAEEYVSLVEFVEVFNVIVSHVCGDGIDVGRVVVDRCREAMSIVYGEPAYEDDDGCCNRISPIAVPLLLVDSYNWCGVRRFRSSFFVLGGYGCKDALFHVLEEVRGHILYMGVRSLGIEDGVNLCGGEVSHKVLCLVVFLGGMTCYESKGEEVLPNAVFGMVEISGDGFDVGIRGKGDVIVG